MGKRQLWLAMMIGGSVAAVLGVSLGALLLLLGLLTGDLIGTGSLLFGGSVAALALGLGGCVAYHGWSGWRGKPARAFPPKNLCWLWATLALAVGLGAAVGRLDAVPAGFLLPAHVITMVLPPLILLVITGKALRYEGETWRGISAGLGGGGLLGMPVALAAEASLVIALGVVGGSLIMSLPGGSETISALVAELQDPALLGDNRRLLELAVHPLVVTALVGLVGVAVPLIEEILKTVAVGFVGAWARPAPARAFLWGVASGAGFAIAENLLNGAVLGRELWVGAVMARMAASVMHCFTGGLVGWGWGQLWTSGRARRFVASLAGAVALHAFWNIAAVGSAILTAAASLGADSVLWAPVAAGIAFAAVVVLGMLALGLAIALPVVAGRLAEGWERVISRGNVPEPPPEATSPTSEDEAPAS